MNTPISWVGRVVNWNDFGASAVNMEDTKPSLWVFGYASICWLQGFDFDDSVTCYLRGYSRKFWQGNITHRGVEGKPGRVATIVEDEKEDVWGVAFQVSGDAAMPYLNTRECVLGGYLTKMCTVYPRPGHKRVVDPFQALVYVAEPNNSLWLGDAPLPDIAAQIVSSRGAHGHNVEYLLKLAVYVRDHIPEAQDDHLFTLERLVRDEIEEKNLCMKTLMGDVSPVAVQKASEGVEGTDSKEASGEASDFKTRMPSKKLHCLKI